MRFSNAINHRRLIGVRVRVRPWDTVQAKAKGNKQAAVGVRVRVWSDGWVRFRVSGRNVRQWG